MHALIDLQSIVVSEGDSTVLIAGTDPVYAKVRRYLVEEHGGDFEVIREMVSEFRESVTGAVAGVISAVDGDEDPEQGPAYRLVHGDPVEEVVLATAIRLTRESESLAPLGAFLARIEANPSPASRSQLFGWLKAGGFTLTTDGMIVGYKSVEIDGRSAHSGNEPVTVVRSDGSSETVTGKVPYPVGATVWMPRDLVNDDRDSACSVGLHVGTFQYAETFSHQMLVVLVDPADVVSVPRDSNAQKMRVCRLVVAAKHDGEQITDAVIENIRTIPDFDATNDYVGRPENQQKLPTFSVAFFDADEDDYDSEDDYDEDGYGDEDDGEGVDSEDDDDSVDESDDDVTENTGAGVNASSEVEEVASVTVSKKLREKRNFLPARGSHLFSRRRDEF